MKLLTHIPAWIKNKYFIAIAAFCVIILFLDKNDLFTQIDRQNQLKKLEQSREYYSDQIATERKELEGFKNDPAFLEKYAREKYLMKREHEELFLLPDKKGNPDDAN